MAPWWVYTIVPPGLFLASVFLEQLDAEAHMKLTDNIVKWEGELPGADVQLQVP